MLSRNILKFVSLRCNINNHLRTLVSSNPNVLNSKEDEREVLALVYQKQFDEALERFKKFESDPETSIDRNAYFRLKLASHLVSNGFENCYDLLDSMDGEIITDEQFSAALERILNSESLENPIENAVKFYKKVVENGIHRKRNRDLLIRPIIYKAALLPDASFNSIWKLYSQLSIIEPLDLSAKEEKIRQKIHSASLWEIIKFTNFLQDKTEKNYGLRILKNFIDSNASPVQADCLNGAWFLFENKVLTFTDFLLVSGKTFSPDHLKYVMSLASITKQPQFLEGFLNYIELFHKPELLAELCEELALVLGKNQDFQGLESLYKRIFKIYKKDPTVLHISYFKKALHRILHFFKCANMAPPDDLFEMVTKIHGR